MKFVNVETLAISEYDDGVYYFVSKDLNLPQKNYYKTTNPPFFAYTFFDGERFHLSEFKLNNQFAITQYSEYIYEHSDDDMLYDLYSFSTNDFQVANLLHPFDDLFYKGLLYDVPKVRLELHRGFGL